MPRFFLLLLLFAATSVAQDLRPIRQLRGDEVETIEKVREFEAALANADLDLAARLAQELIDGAELPLDEEIPDAPEGAPQRRPRFVERSEGGRHRLLESRLIPDRADPASLIPVDRYISRRLGPQAALLERYRRLQGVLAEDLLRSALATGDERSLRRLARRFAVTEAGLKARQTLAHRALERGDFGRAWLDFDLLLEAGIGDPALGIEGIIAARALAASRCEGPGPQTTGRASSEILIGGKGRTLGEFLEALNNNAVEAIVGPHGPLKARWSHRLPERELRRAPKLRIEAQRFDSRVFLRNRFALAALDMESGEELWTTRFSSEEDAKLPESISPGMRSLAFDVDEERVCFVIEPSRRYAEGERILVALSAEDGSLLWRRSSKAGPDGSLRLIWDQGPKLSGDHLYLTAFDGDANPSSYALCLDAKTGETLWITRTGGGVPLPFAGEDQDYRPARAWLGACRPVLDGGSLLILDNLGSFAILDAATGRPLRSYRYPRRQVEARSRSDMASLPRGWAEGRVLVGHSLTLLIPEDSDQALALHRRLPSDLKRRQNGSNAILSDTYARGMMTRAVGLRGDRLILSGIDPMEQLPALEAWEPSGDTLLPWPAPAPLESPIQGRAAMTRNGVYVSSSRYVYRVDVVSGAVSNPILSREAEGPGGLGHVLALPGGIILATTDTVTRLED